MSPSPDELMRRDAEFLRANIAPIKGWRNGKTGTVHCSTLCPTWERVEAENVENVEVG